MKTWPLAVATGLVGATLAFTEVRARIPVSAPERPLADLPRTLGGTWQTTRDLPLAESDLIVLRLSDYVSRVYAAEGERGGPVLLYIGYYASQRTGATYHSPLNCLPGSGWTVSETDYVSVPDVPGMRVKRLVTEREMQKNVVLYWYHDRGRVITSEYTAKVWLIWDGLRYNRTEGSFVRISAPVSTTVEEATARALRFAASLWPPLLERLPAPTRS
jgi:EpsI family protein